MQAGLFTGSGPLLLVCCCGFALLVRYAVSLNGYSGAGMPPMFGDYEAQRHWMEITINLPIGDWYRHTKDNDLMYWGLDYPPLSAYVSWLFGKLAETKAVGQQEMVALFTSRGHETPESKLFMRLSVVLTDILVYFPAVLLFCRTYYGRGGQRKMLLSIFCVLMSPALILIDHGHFQYNNTSIGFAVLATTAILNGFGLVGSFFFCLSLNFKTMSLYMAPAFFFGLLARCIHGGPAPAALAEKGAGAAGAGGEPFSFLFFVVRVAKLGVVVITTFALHWAPFCAYAAEEEGCVAGLGQVLHRMFPFQRGLFEDKVANIWCSLSLLVKVHKIFPVTTLVPMSTALTLLLLAPSAADLLRRPLTSRRFVIGLFISALSFFLGSYQVHEKSLLLALIPATLLCQEIPWLALWLNLLGVFSMFPLLEKDVLVRPYAACTILFATLCPYLLPLQQSSQSFSSTTSSSSSSGSDHPLASLFPGWLLRAYVLVSAAGCVVIHALMAIIPPPARYPDLWTCLVALYACAHLCFAWLYFNVWIWVDRGGAGPGKGSSDSRAKQE